MPLDDTTVSTFIRSPAVAQELGQHACNRAQQIAQETSTALVAEQADTLAHDNGIGLRAHVGLFNDAFGMSLGVIGELGPEFTYEDIRVSILGRGQVDWRERAAAGGALLATFPISDNVSMGPLAIVDVDRHQDALVGGGLQVEGREGWFSGFGRIAAQGNTDYDAFEEGPDGEAEHRFRLLFTFGTLFSI